MALARRFFLSAVFFLAGSILFSYERVPVTIEFKGGGSLYTSFYCFNDLSEGKEIAEEIFSVKSFEKLSKGSREKVLPVPLGTNVGLYDWAIFCYGAEFWLFENKNGWLWGRGLLLDMPRK